MSFGFCISFVLGFGLVFGSGICLVLVLVWFDFISVRFWFACHELLHVMYPIFVHWFIDLVYASIKLFFFNSDFTS